MLFYLRNYSKGNFHLLWPDFCYRGIQPINCNSDGLTAFLNLLIRSAPRGGGGGGGGYYLILFTIYIDLLTALENNGVGCFVKHHFVGAVLR